MRDVFYWLEDHLDALAETRRGEVSRRATNLLSRVFASLGDAVNDGTDWQPRHGLTQLHSRPR